MEKDLTVLLNNEIIQDILYSTLGAAVYSAIIYIGYRKSVRDHRRDFLFLFNLKEVIEEIKHVINKEEKEVDKGNYKNARSSEYMAPKGLDKAVTESLFHKEPINELTLSGLLNNKPNDNDYTEIIGLLVELAQSTYAVYDFLIFKSPDETQDTNLLQIVSKAADNPQLHKRIFAKAMDTNIDYQELVKRFAAEVAAGNVIELGDDVVVITDDGTKAAPTGVSQINNGLKDGDIAFIISFIKKENLDAFNKNHLPQPAQEAPQAPVEAPAPTTPEAPQTPEQGTTNA